MKEPQFRPKKMLLPTDFSASAERSLNTAAALAKEFGSSIYLLNVIPMLPVAMESGYSALFSGEKYLEHSRRHATEKLLASTKALHEDRIDATFGIEFGNDVVGNIVAVLERERCDLIVISTHGVSGWRPIVFGSIAEQVIKLVECPLLLLRTPKSSI